MTPLSPDSAAQPLAKPTPSAPLPSNGQQASPGQQASTGQQAWTVQRVGGDEAATTTVENRGGEIFFSAGTATIITPLPQGYPTPTPPGAIELKKYPLVRRAEVTATNINTDGGRNVAFWPLFNHIQRKEIAMTSPVEMDYPDLRIETVKESSSPSSNWTMSFLYRTPDMGEAGKDGAVLVVDRPALTVLALGMQGQYLSTKDARGVLKLREWLDANPGWKPAGPARALYYNGPDVAPAFQWSEVQIPVEPADMATQAR